MMNFLRKQMKWVMAIIVVAFLLSTFLMYEGRGTRRTPSVNADGTMSDYEVAQINGRSLMRSELERMVRNYLSNYSSRNADSLDMPSIYKTVLDQAVLDSQLDKEVREKGISVSDIEAEQAMKIYADTYYPTRETFYQVLAQSGIKIDDYKKNLARQMAVDKLLSDAIGEVEISEDKAVEFYDTMKNLIYSKPEGFMIHMADFNTSADAENFRARLVNGESWDVIVSKDDIPSKDIINITKAPVFLPSSALTMGTLNVLASLDIAQPSPVFSVSSFDYAVGLKTSHVDETVTPYNEVSADIKTMLTQQEQRKRLNDYEADLRGKAQLVINDEALFAKPQAEVSPEITPEVTIEEVPESEDVVEEAKEEAKSETETETESKDEAAVTVTPEITVEEAKEEEAAVKSEDKAEVIAEEIKEEVKEEEVEVKETEKEEAAETEIKEETKEEIQESKSEDVKAEAEKVETKTEPETKIEEVNEIKAESEEPVLTTPEEPVVVSEEIKEEVKAEEVKEVEEKVTESAEVTPEIKVPEILEKISDEIKEAVTEAVEIKEVENIETGTKTETE